MKNKILLLVSIVLFTSCATKKFKEKWLENEAPISFKARFETTQGVFDIEATREWSPKGADRFYQLIKYGYYDDVAIYRVVNDFVAQFGIHNDSLINKSWQKGIADEPVIQKSYFLLYLVINKSYPRWRSIF